MGNSESNRRNSPDSSSSSTRRASPVPRQSESLQYSTLNSRSPETVGWEHVGILSDDSTVGTASNMASENIEAKLSKLNLNDKKEINILLLGETGAGKSTFINSIFNYLQFEEFKKAEKEHLNVLIPSMFTVEDKNGQMRNVEIGSTKDENEVLITGLSATQAVKTYSFQIKGGQTLVRLIDTPGMGDTRGIKYDQDNCENILSYISRLHHLHAICYLTKSQQSRATVYFQYCVTQILSRLEKSACKNIVFVFTHSKGSNYSPGETFQLLKNLAEEIKRNPAHAEIPLDRNAFCYDNEAFRALAAIKKGVELSPDVRRWSIESWNRSTKECWKMISYILDLPPHMVHNTAAINEARRIIYQLAQPMADIAQLVNNNIQILEDHKRHLDVDTQSLTELKKKLYIPVIELNVTNLTQPVTVCAHLSCSEVYDVGEKKEWHYKTRCHDPCYLTNVPRDIMGSPELINCASMGPDQQCKVCRHSYKVHMHVYYFTEKKHTQRKDDIVSKNINTKELVIENVKKVMREIEQRKTQLELELITIVKCNAKFAHFLSNNAIAVFSDSYAEYINYLMEKERSLGRHADMGKLAGLQKLLREHNELKNTFAEAADMQKREGRADDVTPQDISKSMQELFKLALNGKKIRELFDSQKKSINKEYTFSEYTHKGVFQQSSSDQDNKKQQEKKTGQSSASNPTTKFQRGRPNNRGNFQQRGRGGKSNGPPNQRARTPPPSYFEAGNQPIYPLPADYRSQQQPYPPPVAPAYHTPPPPPARQDSDGNKPQEKPSTIQVNVTIPPTQSTDRDNVPREQPPRDYRYPDYREYPPRPDYYPGNAPPRDYRDYPPRDPYYPPRPDYPPRDSYPSYPPRDNYAPPNYPPHGYPPRDGYPPREYPPRDNYPPREYPPRSDYPPQGYPPRDYYPPREPYPHDPRYGGQGPSSAQYPPRDQRPYNNPAPGNNPQNLNNRNQNNQRGNSNFRGNKNRGGINRKYRKNNNSNNANSNSGDESDTSVASSRK